MSKPVNRIAKNAAAFAVLMDGLNNYLQKTYGLYLAWDPRYPLWHVWRGDVMVYTNVNPALCLGWALAQEPVKHELSG